MVGGVDIEFVHYFKQLGGNNFSFQARMQASLRGLERWLDSIKDARPRKVILCAPQPPALPTARHVRGALRQAASKKEKKAKREQRREVIMPNSGTCEVGVVDGQLSERDADDSVSGGSLKEGEGEYALPPNRFTYEDMPIDGHVERTKMAVEYSTALRALAEARGLAYLDIFDETVDPATGVVRPRFVDAERVSRFDVHLRETETAPLYLSKLRRLLGEGYSQAAAGKSGVPCTALSVDADGHVGPGPRRDASDRISSAAQGRRKRRKIYMHGRPVRLTAQKDA
jgi:hypothetical protein